MIKRIKRIEAWAKRRLEAAASGQMPTERDQELFLTWIAFFQHERLIHLLVTLLFALLTFACFILFSLTLGLILIVLFPILALVLIAYLLHYYKLENGIARLYDLYDKWSRLREDIDE